MAPKNLLGFLVLVSVLFATIYAKPTRKYRYDAEFLDSEIQRIRSGRAEEMEPVWNNSKRPSHERYVQMQKEQLAKADNKLQSEQDKEEEATNSTGSQSDEEEGSDSGGSSDDYYTSSEEIEITCAPDKGWHIRGQRCVPLNCPGGPAERDFNTGECLYSSQPKGRFNRPFHQWNDLNHVYRSNPMSSHFVRSMILMRKG